MAVEFGDQASGFRHKEVIQFINNEVLQNGGGPDFYRAYRSRPWPEVEDQLQLILADPHVPSTLKRANTWSALALGVRFGARQHDEHQLRVQGLLEQMDERVAASTALSGELRRLREERRLSAAEMQATQSALQQVLEEQQKMLQRLCLLESITLALARPPSLLMPPLGSGQHTLSPWPPSSDEHSSLATAVPRLPLCEGHMLCMHGAQCPFLHGLPSSVGPPGLQPLPFQAPLRRRLPYSTFLRAVAPESETAEAAVAATEGASSVAPQMPRQPSYPPGLWVGAGAREEAGLPCAQRSHEEPYPEKLQWECSLVESKSCNQEKGSVYPSGDGRSQSQKDLESSLMAVVLGDNKSPSHKECPAMSQEMSPLGNSSHDQGEGSEKPKEVSSQEYDSGPSGRKFSEMQLSQGQEALEIQEQTAPEPQHLERYVSYHPRDWKCQSCKALNFSWRKACYKCKKSCMTLERKCLGSRKTQRLQEGKN
ncbi:putative testis-expressed protein 13C [Sorex araneus]|uniref:putative testis-expressed protein 13C n=1 Tax=Sorex araneus TaxID=42254 RepID=UPI0024338F63|nr:putative testis-expressed protein 13C [Sorex araneus]